MHRADAADVLDLALHRLELLQRAADDRHPGTERGQLVRGAAADARAASGDDGDLVGEQVGTENGSVMGHGPGLSRAVILSEAKDLALANPEILRFARMTSLFLLETT